MHICKLLSWDMKKQINKQPSCFTSQPQRPPIWTWASPGPKQSVGERGNLLTSIVMVDHLLNVNQGFNSKVSTFFFGKIFDTIKCTSIFSICNTLSVCTVCIRIAVINAFETNHLALPTWCNNEINHCYIFTCSLSHCHSLRPFSFHVLSVAGFTCTSTSVAIPSWISNHWQVQNSSINIQLSF